ncbi:MAG: [FeFe] hydrogenase H-cluster radical SAM maturase HydE [Bacteroidales bacterium]|nr:[FeFe] hydrogenase H-cluster radical SAM maturase HydE [Bacteroidales bacterium]
MQNIVDYIASARDLSLEQLMKLMTADDIEGVKYLFQKAHETAQRVYGNKIFMRGLIEISNHCKNDCLYCGIRRSQQGISRYRLTKEEILECCQQGYGLGFRTFVLQGGEDGWFDDDRMCDIVATIHQQYPDCAITLSLGERSRESYQRLYDAGASRYLLRHETADAKHYAKLHPAEMSYSNRQRCLHDLKEIGYQVGCGFMVGSPFQTLDTLYQDLQLIRRLKPEMVGIGPFIPATGTPFADRPAGTVDATLRLLAIIRLLHPSVLLPATTALGTLYPQGRELGILAGANVVMPNLSPKSHRKEYSIYDNKLATGSEAAESAAEIRTSLHEMGAEAPADRGDYRMEEN